MRQRSLLAPLVLAGSLLTACGTTTPLASRVNESGEFTNHFAMPPSTSNQAGPGGSRAGSTPTAAAPIPTSAEASTAPTTTHALTGDLTTLGVIPGSGPGVTDTTIKIGLTWIDYRALFALGLSVGNSSAKDVQATSMQQDAQAVVDAINREGGLAGRKIIPVWYEYPIQDILNENNAQTDEQAMCARFTQDDHVFAIVTLVSFTGVVNSCAAQHRTFVLASMPTDEALDKSRFAQIGQWWFGPAEMLINRRDQAYVASIVRQHFIPRGAKVGLMTLDTPAIRNSVRSTLKPALGAAGIPITNEIVYGTGTTDNWANYALQMQAAHVDYVLWSYGYGDGNTDQFMAAAASQHYTPKYFLSSDLYPASVATSSGGSQLAGAHGVGWSPVWDIGATWSHAMWNAGDKRCRQTQRDAGISQDGQATMFCDTLFFLQAALRRAPSLTAPGLRQGAAHLDGSYAFSSTTFGISFAAGRHDGVAYVRDMAYNSSTGLWDYTSGNIEAPW